MRRPQRFPRHPSLPSACRRSLCSRLSKQGGGSSAQSPAPQPDPRTMRLSRRRRRPGAAGARSVWPPLPLAAQQDPQTDPVETRYFFFFLRKRKQKRNPTKNCAQQHAARTCGSSTRPRVLRSQACGPGEARSIAALGTCQPLVPSSPSPRGSGSARPGSPPRRRTSAGA